MKVQKFTTQPVIIYLVQNYQMNNMMALSKILEKYPKQLPPEEPSDRRKRHKISDMESEIRQKNRRINEQSEEIIKLKENEGKMREEISKIKKKLVAKDKVRLKVSIFSQKISKFV